MQVAKAKTIVNSHPNNAGFSVDDYEFAQKEIALGRVPTIKVRGGTLTTFLAPTDWPGPKVVSMKVPHFDYGILYLFTNGHPDSLVRANVYPAVSVFYGHETPTLFTKDMRSRTDCLISGFFREMNHSCGGDNAKPAYLAWSVYEPTPPCLDQNYRVTIASQLCIEMNRHVDETHSLGQEAPHKYNGPEHFKYLGDIEPDADKFALLDYLSLQDAVYFACLYTEIPPPSGKESAKHDELVRAVCGGSMTTDGQRKKFWDAYKAAWEKLHEEKKASMTRLSYETSLSNSSQSPEKDKMETDVDGVGVGASQT